jgi:hypothetical protein
VDEARSNKVTEMLRWFDFSHLPPHLQDASAPFAVLALRLVETLPESVELDMALRKLLEAKDCAVRATLAASL